MAKKYKTNKDDFGERKLSLDDHIFYGLTLDEEQRLYRNAIADENNKIVFCNAKAGTGKTFIAVATASLLVKTGKYSKIIYVISPTQESKQGFLPGGIADKSLPYSQPLYDALLTIGENPMFVINQEMNSFDKTKEAYIDFIPSTYIRGSTWQNAVVILEESQNFSFKELKTALTRVADNSKVICIGHASQCDLTRDEKAFAKYIEHFRKQEYCQICTLTKNYRGQVSSWADELES